MSNVKLEKNWIQWYPNKIYFKNVKNRKIILSYSDKFTEEDFCETLKEKFSNENQKNNTELKEMNLTKIKSYEDGFKKGFAKAEKDNLILNDKLNTFFLEFEKSFSIFENKLYSRLLKTVLTISSYVIGKKINIDKSILATHIKTIINQEGICLKKLQLFIHPDNKILMETMFKDLLKTYQWKLIYDDNIDLNGCKIKSENGCIDSTVDARWQELHRFIYSEEY